MAGARFGIGRNNIQSEDIPSPSIDASTRTSQATSEENTVQGWNGRMVKFAPQQMVNTYQFYMWNASAVHIFIDKGEFIANFIFS